MFVDLTGGKPIRCSKCGSTNASRPVNNRDIEIRCDDCGHQKLTAEAERRQFEEQYPEFTSRSWSLDAVTERDPTF